MSERQRYPRLVAIETTSHCNAKCVFCPNNALARGKEHMSDDLFESIVDQCRDMPIEAIEPFLQGEPLSDPKIMARLEHIRVRVPHAKLRLYSNGYALTPKRIDQLVGLGLDRLYISVNTLDPVKYKNVMGLELERTLANLEYLVDPARKSRVAREITFRMLRTPEVTLEEQDKFVDYCKKRRVGYFIVGLFNYKGDIHSDMPIPGYPCEHIDRLDILTSGRVTLCCMDQNGEYAWGDVTKQSLIDVYRGEVAVRYQTMHRTGRRREIEPCDKCNLFWPSLRELPPLQKARFAYEVGCYFLKHRPTGRRAPTKTA